MLTTYQRVMEVWRRPVIDDRGLCVCGHAAHEHDHYVAECARCTCEAYTDQNDLERSHDGDD